MPENWLLHAFLLYNCTEICYRYTTHHIIFVKKQVATLLSGAKKLELNNNHLTIKILQ